jgi:hypothetical protein
MARHGRPIGDTARRAALNQVQIRQTELSQEEVSRLAYQQEHFHL